MSGSNKYVEAFKEGYNTVSLGALAAVSLALLNPLPLLAGVVLEAAYLLTVPDSKWYEQRLSARYDAEIRARRDKLKNQYMPNLRRSMQERYLRLEQTRDSINVTEQEGKTWYREVLRKLDYLLEKFILFANKEQQFRDYLRGVMQDVIREESREAPRKSPDSSEDKPKKRVPQAPPQQVWWEEPPLDPCEDWTNTIVARVQEFYKHEVDDITETITSDTDDLHNNAILEKRQEVLQRRNEFVGKSGKILINLNHQLQLMEDTFGLINDEIRARSPEQVLADIDEVVVTTNSLTEAIEAVSPLEELVAKLPA